jgi:hypothetical protein
MRCNDRMPLMSPAKMHVGGKQGLVRLARACFLCAEEIGCLVMLRNGHCAMSGNRHPVGAFTTPSATRSASGIHDPFRSVTLAAGGAQSRR